jgi:hypothetical protein
MQRCATGISSKVLSLRGKANFRAFSSLLSSVDELMGMFQEPKAQRSKSGTTKPCQLKSELALKISRKYPSLPSLQGNLVGCERLDILMYLSSTCYPLEEKFIQAVKTFHKDQDIALPQVSTSQHLFLLKLRQLSTPTYEVLIDYIMKQDILSGMVKYITKKEKSFKIVESHTSGFCSLGIYHFTEDGSVANDSNIESNECRRR